MAISDAPLAMSFDSIELIRIPVTIAGEEYMLVEAGAEAGVMYEDSMIGSVVMKDGKPVSISNVNQRDLQLLKMCLFRVEKNAKGEERLVRVDPKIVGDLKLSVFRPLVDTLKKISGLEDTKPELGNESSDSETSSESPTD